MYLYVSGGEVIETDRVVEQQQYCTGSLRWWGGVIFAVHRFLWSSIGVVLDGDASQQVDGLGVLSETQGKVAFLCASVHPHGMLEVRKISWCLPARCSFQDTVVQLKCLLGDREEPPQPTSLV